jgi:hypothetical protein
MPTPAELESLNVILRDQLKKKPGIFKNTQAHPLSINFTASERAELHPEQFSELAILEDLERRFKNIAITKAVNTDSLPVSFNIAALKNNIVNIERAELPNSNHQKQFSHLGIFLGLDNPAPGAMAKICLVMFGVKLSDATMADLTAEPALTSDIEFSNFQTVPTSGNADAGNINHLQMRRRFINVFSSAGRKIIRGVYIRLRSSINELDILKVLDKLQAEGADTVKISVGFYSQQANPDHNIPDCLHLTFRGNIPGSTFSTWDGEGYTGPKTGCPPFGCKTFSSI